MLILILVTITLVIVWVFEYLRHCKNVFKIPHRIHVNGTRGKSSVTRLISAGLRAGNMKTVAKTTGTLPRFIYEDGKEAAIVRLAGANIIEQKYVFRYAVKSKPDVLVMECMAVNPVLQWITERQFVKSTISVITNSRPDHLDQMGTTVESVTQCLCNTIPRNGHCFTAEEPQFPLMKSIAEKRNCKIYKIRPNKVTDSDMQKFHYIEHKENVELALEVCTHLGVKWETALNGMQNMNADPGALMKYNINDRDKHIYFYNVFAANDPESTMLIWNNITNYLHNYQQKIMILNTRADRYFRSLQLLDVCTKVDFDYLFLTGEKTEQIYQDALSKNLPKDKLRRTGEIEPAKLYEQIWQLTDKAAHIVGVGNIAGQRQYGGQIVNYYFSRFSKQKKEEKKGGNA